MSRSVCTNRSFMVLMSFVNRPMTWPFLVLRVAELRPSAPSRGRIHAGPTNDHRSGSDYRDWNSQRCAVRRSGIFSAPRIADLFGHSPVLDEKVRGGAGRRGLAMRRRVCVGPTDPDTS